MGDVHGCADELERLVHLAQPTRVVLVGDLFTKGPKPLETWQCIERVGAEAVLGNHDAAMLAHPERFIEMNLPPRAWAWLEQLPLMLQVAQWTVVHAGLDGSRTGGDKARDCVGCAALASDKDDQHPSGLRSGRSRVGHLRARRDPRYRDHRPSTLGLDTGCVCGRLTGYLVEADRLVSVAAAAVYRAVDGPRFTA